MPECLKLDNTRERLIDSALKLFVSQGINITGVMAIAAMAGVTKMTLYSHFPSKDALIVACLEERDRRWREEVAHTLAGHPDPISGMLAFFDLYQRFLLQDSGRGCLFVNSAAEFPQFSHPVHLAVSSHKQGIRENLAALAMSAGVSDPGAVAEGLFILLEGSFVSGAMGQDAGVFDTARHVAQCWIQKHCQQEQSV
ncbi:TetR family transcriptional regulator [Pseudomonas protegens]|nr:TetR family transcriptional regulator [Pseudomonas protegens]ROL96323.1 TetR family transcriptional regulator [Pseudomonas protegens]ROL98192.1 TetR family transcriptional regulator [Pseudomonas protegens]ROM07979.1 TetR family transcriptional regulator [Pseudomonas protegens]